MYRSVFLLYAVACNLMLFMLALVANESLNYYFRGSTCSLPSATTIVYNLFYHGTIVYDIHQRHKGAGLLLCITPYLYTSR